MKKRLNIKVLSLSSEIYSTRRIVEAATQMGHNVTVDSCLDYILTEQHWDLDPIPKDVHAVIPRIGGPLVGLGSTAVQAFEAAHIYTTASSSGLTASKDKFKTIQLLKAAGVSIPKTVTFGREESIEEAVEYLGGYPVVVKLLTGSQGRSVILVESANTGKSLMQTLLNKRDPFLVQEFIKEAKGADLRCLVVNGDVVGAMVRQGAPGEFRSNLHQGGSATLAKLSPAERKAALMSAKALKLDVAGVDILRSETGPKILEVNSSPGLEGIEAATGKDIAAEIINCVEANISPVLRRAR